MNDTQRRVLSAVCEMPMSLIVNILAAAAKRAVDENFAAEAMEDLSKVTTMFGIKEERDKFVSTDAFLADTEMTIDITEKIINQRQ